MILDLFLQENSNFPCYNCTMQKSLVKIIFRALNFYSSTKFQNFCGTFYDMEF